MAGADIRHIQAQLGDADLSTTQIYTHVAVGKLKEVHAATHPINLVEESESAVDDGGDGERIRH